MLSKCNFYMGRLRKGIVCLALNHDTYKCIFFLNKTFFLIFFLTHSVCTTSKNSMFMCLYLWFLKKKRVFTLILLSLDKRFYFMLHYQTYYKTLYKIRGKHKTSRQNWTSMQRNGLEEQLEHVLFSDKSFFLFQITVLRRQILELQQQKNAESTIASGLAKSVSNIFFISHIYLKFT